jgi:hypothetical protein
VQTTAIDLFSANRSVQHNSFRWFYPFHANKIPVPHRWGIHAYVIEFNGVLAALAPQVVSGASAVRRASALHLINNLDRRRRRRLRLTEPNEHSR